MKTSISKVTTYFEERDEEVEAHLWRDNETGELTVSTEDPWYGYENSKDVIKLGKALLKWGERMKRNGQ